MSHCLITGGQGRIGSALFLALRDTHHVTSFDDGSNNCVSLAENVAVDVTDLDALRFAFKKHGPFDVVFHLAAVTRPERSLENPLRCHAVNAGGTLNVLEVLRESGHPSVFVMPTLRDGDDLIFDTHFSGEEYATRYGALYGMNTIIANASPFMSCDGTSEEGAAALIAVATEAGALSEEVPA